MIPFLFWPFLKGFSINELDQFPPNLTLLSLANPFGMTHEGVAPVYMVRLKALPVPGPVMWRHVGVSRIGASAVT
jgi:hypothetical protein